MTLKWLHNHFTPNRNPLGLQAGHHTWDHMVALHNLKQLAYLFEKEEHVFYVSPDGQEDFF